MASADTLNYISSEIYIYGYSFIVLTGLFGNTLNMIIFLNKLKGSVCTIYLLIGEITDTLTILIYILPTIVGLVYGKNGTESNVGWCRFINWTSDITNLMSTSMLCMASIDRYLCSSRRVQLRQWSSTKVAYIAIVIIVCCAFLLTIPDLLHLYIDRNIQQCIYDQTDLQYASYFLIPVMLSFVPLVTLLFFGYKAYQNLQQIHPDGVTGVAINQQTRRQQRQNNQLSRMLIPQIIVFLFQTTTFFAINLYITVTYEWPKSDMRMAIENLLEAVIFVFYDMYTCISFYIYYTQSKAFRMKVNKLFTRHRQVDDGVVRRTMNTIPAVVYHIPSGVTMPVGRSVRS